MGRQIGLGLILQQDCESQTWSENYHLNTAKYLSLFVYVTATDKTVTYSSTRGQQLATKTGISCKDIWVVLN